LNQVRPNSSMISGFFRTLAAMKECSCKHRQAEAKQQPRMDETFGTAFVSAYQARRQQSAILRECTCSNIGFVMQAGQNPQ
jgi:hypothetical protein